MGRSDWPFLGPVKSVSSRRNLHLRYLRHGGWHAPSASLSLSDPESSVAAKYRGEADRGATLAADAAGVSLPDVGCHAFERHVAFAPPQARQGTPGAKWRAVR